MRMTTSLLLFVLTVSVSESASWPDIGARLLTDRELDETTGAVEIELAGEGADIDYAFELKSLIAADEDLNKEGHSAKGYYEKLFELNEDLFGFADLGAIYRADQDFGDQSLAGSGWLGLDILRTLNWRGLSDMEIVLIGGGDASWMLSRDSATSAQFYRGFGEVEVSFSFLEWQIGRLEKFKLITSLEQYYEWEQSTAVKENGLDEYDNMRVELSAGIDRSTFIHEVYVGYLSGRLPEQDKNSGLFTLGLVHEF